MDELKTMLAASWSRRGFIQLTVAGTLAAGAGALGMTRVAAREAEPGDDHGGHGRGRDDKHRHHHRREHGRNRR